MTRAIGFIQVRPQNSASVRSDREGQELQIRNWCKANTIPLAAIIVDVVDNIIGLAFNRPALKRAAAMYRPGDVFVFVIPNNETQHINEFINIQTDFKRIGIKVVILNGEHCANVPKELAGSTTCITNAELHKEGKSFGFPTTINDNKFNIDSVLHAVQSSKSLGEFYTPRAVVQMLLKYLK
jgi:hypothetical protein